MKSMPSSRRDKSSPASFQLPTSVAGRGNKTGIFYEFSERYFLAQKTLLQFEEFTNSQPLTIEAFDERHLLDSFYAKTQKGSRKGVPHKVLMNIIATKTNIRAVLGDYRHQAPEDLKHLSQAIVNIAACNQLLGLLEIEEVRGAAERLRAKTGKSFGPETLYKNPFFAPQVTSFAFSMKSIRAGFSSGAHRSLKIGHLRHDGDNIFHGLVSLRPRLHRGPQQGGASVTREIESPLVRSIITEYNSLVESLEVAIKDFNEEEIIHFHMSHESKYFRTPKSVLRNIRHQYTNYDLLYFSEEVRRREYWHLTGYLASQKAVYLQLREMVKTDMLRGLISDNLAIIDAKLVSTAKHAARQVDVRQFLRERYIAEVHSNIKDETRRQVALSYAS